MRRFLAVVLALGMSALPGVAAQEDALLCYRVDTSACEDEVTVDLLEDAGSRIDMEVEADRFPFEPTTVTMFLDCDCGASMRLNMPRDGDAFVTALQVDTIDLVVGTWTAIPQGSGSGQTQALEAKTLAVTADDDLAPGLTIENLDDTDTVLLGAGSLLQITPEDELLGRVTYRADWMPTNPFALDFPYDIAVGTFRPGAQEVTVTAHDRAGHSTTETFTVLADARDPEVGVDAPDVFYQGIGNTVVVTVKDHSAYTITASVGGGSGSASEVGDGEDQVTALQVNPAQVGQANLRVRVTDALGNEALLEIPTAVTELETDGLLVSAQQTSAPIQGEDLELVVTGRQQGALAPVDFTIRFGDDALGTIEVPDDDEVTKTLTARFEPGRHTATLRMDPPASVHEVNFTDQEMQMTLEVFLARVIHGDDVYHIRADGRGLPLEAVDADGNVYATSTENLGLGQVYAFTADGQQLHWNPATNTTIIPTDDGGATTDDNGTPGPGAMLVLAAIAAALLVRRRR